MKSKFFRFVAVCLLLLFGLTTFQSSALARPRGDDGESRAVASHAREEIGGGGGVWGGPPSWLQRFRQGKPLRDRGLAPGIREGAERRNPSNDRERREIVKEVTGERHMPGGGPQDN